MREGGKSVSLAVEWKERASMAQALSTCSPKEMLFFKGARCKQAY